MFNFEKSTEFCHIRGHQFSDSTKQASRYASYSSIDVEISGRKLRSWWKKVSSIKLFYMNLRKLAVHSKKNWIYIESSTDSHATNENPKGRFRVLFFFEIAEQARTNEFFYMLGSLNDVFF